MYMRMSLIMTIAVWWSFQAVLRAARKLLVEFFKAEAAVVLFLDLLDGVFEHLPDDVDVFLVH